MPGDIAYNKMRAWQSAIDVSRYRGIVSPAYIVVRLYSSNNPDFFHFLLRTPGFATEAERWSYGITSDQWSLRPEHFKMIYCCIPSREEQDTIVKFLQQFNCKVSRFIRNKRRLIELLQEQKQAIINRAVTRGINPDVLLKPTGIDWLPEIPEGWAAIRAGSLASSLQTGPFGSQLHAQDYKPNGTPVINPSHMKNGRIVPDTNCAIDNKKMWELEQLVALGEDSQRQFKRDLRNTDSLASDLVAFSNSEGGVILIGVADDGFIPGLPPDDVRRINQLIGNAATQHVRSPISPRTENVPAGDDRVVIVVTVPVGIDKPYFDRQGVIWVKSGSDKRRIQSKEELRRLFQDVDLLHADEVPTRVGVEALDRLRFRDFLAEVFQQELPETDAALNQLLENMNLASAGRLNLAGLLLFGRQPQLIKPAFAAKAVSYPGTVVDVAHYLDSEDFEGPLSKVFEGALGFVMRALPKQQRGRGINEPGQLPVPRIVFEELLVNALMHRDYFIEAPVRLFIFQDRIEIISPGNLPNHLTVEKIRAGNSVLRNPILASYAAKGILPYRGLGTGIRRALAEWNVIDFIDDREACTFNATVRFIKVQDEPNDRPDTAQGAPKRRNKGAPKPNFASINAHLTELQKEIVASISSNPEISYDEMAQRIGKNRTTIMRNISRMKGMGLLVRVGSKKTGYWKVVGMGVSTKGDKDGD